MKNKIYHLSSCSTCQNILKKLNLNNCNLQDIKTEQISEKQLDTMAKLSGSYESLFSRKAIKYRTLGLKDKILSEIDYKNLILGEYTFLKRPIVIAGKKILIGNTNAVIDEATKLLNSNARK
ncbi:MAG: hypothetical protein IPO62_15785 [Saprospiraceae bacterium]|nr:hypothetical protein [Saprospiraceae bacterium]MBK9632488.1 hypothetical protein [Saprospiraceae bacterium]